MPNAASAAAAEPLHPDPDRAGSARLDPAGAGKVLHLLSTLFAYGRNLVEKLREEDDPDDLPWYAFLTSFFGTTNPALITVVIIRGLLRVRALQARLSSRLARGRDSLLSLPVRQDGGARAPGRSQPRTPGWAIPPGWPVEDTFRDRQPMPEDQMFAEIVAEDRDRPIGAILLDICLDLGIVPALMDPATWDELRRAITLHGGDPAPLLACGVDAVGTPAPGDSPTIPVVDQPIIVFPPWPAPPETPPPLAGGGWGRGPGP